MLRSGPWSVRVDARAALVGALLLLAVGACTVVALGLGRVAVPPAEVLEALLGRGEPGASFAVVTLRLPRALTAALVGAALGASGALFQALARNPLGAPDVLGVTGGASAGAVLVLAVTGGASGAALAGGALAGALLTTALVVALSTVRGVLSPYRLVLVGVGAAFVTRAGVDVLLTRAGVDEVAEATVWLAGSLSTRTWDDVLLVSTALVLLVPAVLLGRALDRLALGDAVAVALGVRVGATRLLAVAVGAGLAAGAVAAAGPVTFVAFMAGPLARRLVRSPGSCVLPAAAAGALLVALSDLVAQHALPVPLPTGVVTAVLGAPVLLWLLGRTLRPVTA